MLKAADGFLSDFGHTCRGAVILQLHSNKRCHSLQSGFSGSRVAFFAVDPDRKTRTSSQDCAFPGAETSQMNLLGENAACSSFDSLVLKA